MNRWRALAVLIATLAPLALGAAVSSADQPSGPAFPGPGEYLHGSYDSDGTAYAYSLYVPSTYQPAHPSPLVVLLHGCKTTADDRARSSAFNPIAERNQVVVLYPEGDLFNRTANGRCWKAVDLPGGETRGNGDAAAIAGMTRAVMGQWRIDRERVYLFGMSSGAFETSMAGADYPDLYAAIGVFSGAAYRRGPAGCVGLYLPVADTSTLAQDAFEQMGPRQRVVPVIFFHGDADWTVPYKCGRQALEQWRQTDNLALTARGMDPISAEPTSVRDGTAEAGATYRVEDYYRRPGRCLQLQFWTVHGMGHKWSGGSGDPDSIQYTYPRGPDASLAAWRFFEPIRLGSTPCAGNGAAP